MRFCPFCSAENADEATHCGACARRLPALPRRRTEAAADPPAAPELRAEPQRATSTPSPRASTGAVMPAPHSRPADLLPVGPAAQRRQPSAEPPPPPGVEPRRATDERRNDSTGEPRAPTLPEPPPTRPTIADPVVREYRPARLDPIPDVPEAGFLPAAKYAVSFLRARWQRRAAIRQLGDEIRTETAALDAELGALGRRVRAQGVDNRALASENAAIDAAEARKQKAEQSSAELSAREAEENAKFSEVSTEREGKLREAEHALDRAEREHGALEAQRRGLRDKRKQIETQQKGYLKAADDRDAQAAKANIGDDRINLRRSAEDLRRDAAALDPERQDIERRLAALERPLAQALAKLEALKQEHDAAKHSLEDAREGHRHRLAEIEAEQGRRSRELAAADAEVQRRFVTLGTLVNLNRVDSPELSDLYARIDRLRGAIGAQSTEIDRLTAEREAYDKASLVRGLVAIGGGLVALITFIVILVWIF